MRHISYIYKNKGKLQELTSYRPVALTSMLVNIFKTMWLQRLVSVVDKHLSHCHGGFRVGSGVKEKTVGFVRIHGARGQ